MSERVRSGDQELRLHGLEQCPARGHRLIVERGSVAICFASVLRAFVSAWILASTAVYFASSVDDPLASARVDAASVSAPAQPTAQPNVSLVAATPGITIVRQPHGTTTFVVSISHP